MSDAPAGTAGAGAEVELREVRAADLPILYRQQLDPEATAMAAFPPRDELRFMAHWSTILTDATGRAQAVVAGGEVAGYVVAFDLDGQRQVGYWIGREHWGQGIATRALEALLALELRRPLHAHVAKHNLGSIRVLEKCGFRVVGEEREEVRGEEAESWVLVLH